MTDAPPLPKRRLRLALALTGLLILAVALVAYAARRAIAREILVGWLESKGVAADATVYAIGPAGFVGALRAGDPKAPDFAAERVEVRYAIKGFAVEVGSVVLRQATLRADLRGGKVSLGSLDPIVEEFTRRPPRPDARTPKIEIVGGRALVQTDYGPADVRADALVDGGKLMRLSAVGAPMSVRGKDFAAELGQVRLSLATHDDSVDVRLVAPIVRGTFAQGRIEDAQIAASAIAPYPDLQKKRGDGRVIANVQLSAASAAFGEEGLQDLVAKVAFTGEARGWIADLNIVGKASADLSAASASGGGASLRSVKVAATAEDLDWSRAGGDRISAGLKIAGSLDSARAADLTLTRASAAFSGSALYDKGVLGGRLTGAVNARGSYAGMGPVAEEDSPEIAAVKRGLRDFSVSAPGMVLASDDKGARIGLSAPVRLTTATGGTLAVSPAGRGGYGLRMGGGGLPVVDAAIENLAFDGGATSIRGRVRTKLGVGPLQGVDANAAGTLRLAGGAMTFTASRCVIASVAHVELGENDVESIAGEICPVPGRPMATVANGGWRLDAEAKGVSALAPFLQVRVSEAAGPLTFGLARGAMFSTVAIHQAALRDAAPEVRFEPMVMTGSAGLSGEVWSAELDIGVPRGAKVAHASLRHDGAAARGGVEIDTGKLVMSPDGLQPEQISPLAAAAGSPAEGEVEFYGRFDWTAETLSSAGALGLRNVSFQSPAARVNDLDGEIGFSSLAPLIAASGQTVTVASVDALVPLTDVKATFAIEEKALVIAGAEADVGGGKVTMEALNVPLTPEEPMKGVLALQGVQLHDLVKASPFGDKVELDAKVDGRLPFEALGGKVKISSGELHAIQPGRLSIQRTALTGVAASGATAVPVDGAPAATAVAEAAAAAVEQAPNTVTDFAYQAMQNLAFDTLQATVDSTDSGRLGVRFHIVGRHDPPQKQEIRLGLMDLIRRDFLNRELPLPSGVGVDLTLDTSLNLNDLLADYGEYQRLKNSPDVQPPSPIPTTKTEPKP